VLDQLVDQIDAGERFLVCEAGTGVGKSAIAVTIGGYVDSLFTVPPGYDRGTYILTSQKTLQDQYLRDFPRRVVDLRSSANFSCTEGPGENCGQTMRYKSYMQKKEGGCPNCPYKLAKTNFIEAAVGVTNYAYLISEHVYAGQLNPRRLLVLDEAHNVESEMRRWATFLIDEETATDLGLEFPFDSSESKSLAWVREYVKAVGVEMDSLTARIEQAEKRNVLKGMKSLVDKLDRFDRQVCAINRVIKDTDNRYLTEWSEERSGRRVLRVQPLEPGPIANEVLYPMGYFVLCMSATILDQEQFQKSVGIDELKMVSEPTPFPPENFGIVYKPVGRMSRAHMSKTLPKMVAAVRQILNAHPKEKGIIHCANYDVARALGNIRDKRLLVQTNARDRDEILRRHTTSDEPTVIVSPSMMEGLDLDGDLGRFQVICKVPFPNMGDPVVAAKMDRDRKWYSWCTVRSVVQAVGRCVRSREDWAKTYILDESFGELFTDCESMFPPHFFSMEIDA
jgi:Rad3-related DNA helicase